MYKLVHGEPDREHAHNEDHRSSFHSLFITSHAMLPSGTRMHIATMKWNNYTTHSGTGSANAYNTSSGENTARPSIITRCPPSWIILTAIRASISSMNILSRCPSRN